MAKKDNSWIGWVIAIGMILLAVKAGWFGNLSQTNVIIINSTHFLNNPTLIKNQDCTLSFDKNLMCVGDEVTGIINDGNNKNCYVFANDGTGWVLIYQGVTSPLGILTETQAINILGTFTFRAICDLNNNGYFDADDCITNPSNLVVTDAVPPCPLNGDDDGVSYTCGLTGPETNKCDGTCPSDYPMCVDMWFDISGGYTACACINPNTETVHPDWKPDGIYHNPWSEYITGQIGTIFVTKNFWNGAMGGLSGMDAKCQTSASFAGLSGTWIAIASDMTTSATSRIPDTMYYLLNGNKVANSKVDLFDNSILVPINIDEYSHLVPDSSVWTGSYQDGQSFADLKYNCNQWQWVSDGYNGIIGSTALTDGRWIHVGPGGKACAQSSKIYCVRVN